MSKKIDKLPNEIQDQLDSDFLSTKEVAEILGISRADVRKLIRAEKLPAIKVDDKHNLYKWLVSKEDLNNYIDSKNVISFRGKKSGTIISEGEIKIFQSLNDIIKPLESPCYYKYVEGAVGLSGGYSITEGKPLKQTKFNRFITLSKAYFKGLFDLFKVD